MKKRSTAEEDTVLPWSGRRVDYESRAGGDNDEDDYYGDYGDDRYGISTTDLIVDAPRVRGYDDRDDYDCVRNDRRRDDDNVNGGGSENAKERVRRRRYGRIYEGTALIDKVLDGHTVVIVTTSAAEAVVEGEGGGSGSGLGSGDGLGDDDDDDENASYSGTRLICYPLAPPGAITTAGTGTCTTTTAKNARNEKRPERRIPQRG